MQNHYVYGAHGVWQSPENFSDQRKISKCETLETARRIGRWERDCELHRELIDGRDTVNCTEN
jgi:hypothetical protein